MKYLKIVGKSVLTIFIYEISRIIFSYYIIKKLEKERNQYNKDHFQIKDHIHLNDLEV